MDYKIFYRKDLLEMLDRATLAVIRGCQSNEDPGEKNCPMQYRLNGIFALADELRARLDDPEVE